MKSLRLPLAAVLFAASAAAPAWAGPITQIVSFGDSLSDVGNTAYQYGYPAAPPYDLGRYSNGPIWLDNLAAKLHLGQLAFSQQPPGGPPHAVGGTDYAFGGATVGATPLTTLPGYSPLINPALQVIGLVPNVDTQIASYLAKNTPNAKTLYTLWAGANDFFDGQTNPLAPADGLKADIETLIAKGAKNFLIANLPSLDQTPLGRSEGAAAQAGLKALTAGFNAELAADLNQIQAAHPDVHLYQLDAFGLLQKVETDPAAYGLTNAKDPALFAPPGTNTDGYLFWDDVHPTAAASQIIADAAYKAVAPEPSAVVLLVTGCGGWLGWRLRRRRRLFFRSAHPPLQ